MWVTAGGRWRSGLSAAGSAVGDVSQVKPWSSLANGSRAVVVLNKGPASVDNYRLNLSDLGFANVGTCTYGVSDLRAGTSSTSTGAVTVNEIDSHGGDMLTISPEKRLGASRADSSWLSPLRDGVCVQFRGRRGRGPSLRRCRPAASWPWGTAGVATAAGGFEAGVHRLVALCHEGPVRCLHRQKRWRGDRRRGVREQHGFLLHSEPASRCFGG